LALVLGLLSGCGGSSSDDSSTPPTNGTTTNGTTPNVTTPNVTTPVYSYDFPVNVARDAFPVLPVLSKTLTTVDRSQFTITYTGVSESDKNTLVNTLLAKYFTGGNGVFTLKGLNYSSTYYINEAVARVQYNGVNGLYDITLSIILDGDYDIYGSGFFEDVFTHINAQVSSISTTSYYDEQYYKSFLFGNVPVPQTPPEYTRYKELLTLAHGYEHQNDSLLTSIVALPSFITVLAEKSLYKTVGDFKYEWSYTSKVLGFYGSSSTWIVSRIGSI
jgi:hypothetical protein